MSWQHKRKFLQTAGESTAKAISKSKDAQHFGATQQLTFGVSLYGIKAIGTVGHTTT